MLKTGLKIFKKLGLHNSEGFDINFIIFSRNSPNSQCAKFLLRMFFRLKCFSSLICEILVACKIHEFTKFAIGEI